MSEKPKLIRVVPGPKNILAGNSHMSMGTKVYVGDQPVTGVTKIEITAEVGQSWRAVIHCYVEPPELVDCVVVTPHAAGRLARLWRKIKRKARDITTLGDSERMWAP